MSGALEAQARGRRRAMLQTAMGPAIAAALADPLVVEIMVNPDGVLRLDRLGEGRIETGARLEPAEAERIVRLVASHVRAEVHADAPIISAELPVYGDGSGGERFEGLLPPVASVRVKPTKGSAIARRLTTSVMAWFSARSVRRNFNRAGVA